VEGIFLCQEDVGDRDPDGATELADHVGQAGGLGDIVAF
jgi:hypothetical protein